jgi:hypothetical protein
MSMRLQRTYGPMHEPPAMQSFSFSAAGHSLSTLSHFYGVYVTVLRRLLGLLERQLANLTGSA